MPYLTAILSLAAEMEPVVVVGTSWDAVPQDISSCIAEHFHPLQAALLLKDWRGGEFAEESLQSKGLRPHPG